jgi:hypothetical protein
MFAAGTSVAEVTGMIPLRANWLLHLSVLCSALACSEGDDGTRKHRTTLENEGGLCLRSSTDETLAVTLVFPACLSSSCDRVISTSCQVTASGTELVISGKAQTETTGAEACTADCGSLVARCTSAGAIPPGPYTVKLGTESANVALAQTPVELFHEAVPFRPCSLN